MSEREAMTLKVVAYHNEQARGASFEWHARCATHAENQEQIIKALADALSESAPLFSVSNGPCWCHSPVPADDADHRDDCRKRRASLRIAGRL